MSGFLAIGLIVVVWLVVLAPLLLRGQKPIRKAGEAFDETRVILEGGSSVPMRRRPRLAADSTENEAVELDQIDDDYEIVDSPSIFRHRREDLDDDDGDDQTEESETTDVSDLEETDNTVVSSVVVHEDVTPAPVVEVVEEWIEEDHYPMDDSYSAPIDLMHPSERARAFAEYQAVNVVEELPDTADMSDELTDEDVEFAKRRRGRGYYDPQADHEFAQSQYTRRQRTLIGLAGAVVVTVVLGFVLGGWAWFLPVAAVASTAVYLAALRNQVRAESALRARRIRRLRRSRMGVRNSEDLPQRLRRPGAVVLELDDESPDFEGLSTTFEPAVEHDDTHRHSRTRRVS